MKEKFLNGLNTLLTLNLFFVLFSFAWFAIALLGKSLNFPLGFDLWYRLWEPVFTPAIGILMAGALGNGIISWITRHFPSHPKSS